MLPVPTTSVDANAGTANVTSKSPALSRRTLTAPVGKSIATVLALRTRRAVLATFG